MPKKRAAKPKSISQSLMELTTYLYDRYYRWYEIYTFGCSDPSWEDGTNLYLVRNHILITRKNIEDLLKDNYFLYPDIYFIPVPPQVPFTFMAVDRVLRGEVIKSTKELNYNEILRFEEDIFTCV